MRMPFTTIMHMRWHDLLFAHWSFEPEQIQSLLPVGMVADTLDERAWLGIVPFRMTGIRLRGLPGLPTTHAFVELNVRTYVRVNDEPGVYFFSLDAPHRLPNAIARAAFKLSYQRAAMQFRHEGESIAFRSMRINGDEMFVARYRSIGQAGPTQPGSLAYFLTSRYRMYMDSAAGQLWYAGIAHEPWQLSEAEAAIDLNTMAQPLGLDLTGAPHLLFSPGTQTRVGRPRRVARVTLYRTIA